VDDCEQTTEVRLFENSNLGNITAMIFDRSGRLLLSNTSGQVLRSESGEMPQLVLQGGHGLIASMSVDTSNRLWITYFGGWVEVRNGDELTSVLASTNVGVDNAAAAAAHGGAWGNAVYIATSMGGMAPDATLHQATYNAGLGTIELELLGGGMSGPVYGAAFGPDDALYLVMGSHSPTLRITLLNTVPAVSGWGLTVMGLLVASVGTTVLWRKRNAPV
jgi:hypothetical protein